MDNLNVQRSILNTRLIIELFERCGNRVIFNINLL